MSQPIRLALAGAVMLLGGCTTTTRNAPVDVTRYHLGQPMERTTVAVEPERADMAGPEFQTYADAVAGELERLGYVKSRSDMASGYIAVVSFRRASRGSFRDTPPVSIGLGGGTASGGYRGGSSVGAGVSFGIGGKTREIYATELSVQLRRRADNSTIWEGKARTDTIDGQPGETAVRLAGALFKDFPGESGITTTVK